MRKENNAQWKGKVYTEFQRQNSHLVRQKVSALKNSLIHIGVLCGLTKAIARHSLTGLNIIIFHDNQQEKLENNYKASF